MKGIWPTQKFWRGAPYGETATMHRQLSVACNGNCQSYSQQKGRNIVNLTAVCRPIQVRQINEEAVQAGVEFIK